MLTRFPMAPSGRRNAQSCRRGGDFLLLPQSPVFQPHAEGDAGRVVVIVISGVHGRGALNRNRSGYDENNNHHPPEDVRKAWRIKLQMTGIPAWENGGQGANLDINGVGPLATAGRGLLPSRSADLLARSPDFFAGNADCIARAPDFLG